MCIPTFLPTRSPALRRGFEGRDAMHRGLPWKIVAKPMHATLRAMAGISTFCSTDPMATCTALLHHGKNRRGRRRSGTWPHGERVRRGYFAPWLQERIGAQKDDACRRSLLPDHQSTDSLRVHAGRPVHSGRAEGVRASFNLLTVLFGKVMSASISLWRLATSSGSSPPSGVGGRKETSSPLALYRPLSAATKSPANWEHGW
jgi:hypothetical protein